MSRYCGSKDPSAVLVASAHWRDVALLENGSVFGVDQIWTADNLKVLDKYFTQNLDTGSGKFLQKFEAQLAPCAPAVKQLAAEAMWLMFLAPSNITPAKKREVIKTIWEWSETLLPASPWLSDETLTGIGSGGPGFNNHRWRELSFCITAMLAFKSLPAADQKRIGSDAWSFDEWLQTVKDADSRQLRHMLLYLMFPDTFERIFSGGDRRRIALAFSGKPASEINEMTAEQLDALLSEVRKAQEVQHGTTQLDFYHPPIDNWGEDANTKIKSISRANVEAAIKRIDEDGIPDDARSALYDLVHNGNRYPPKLVMSLAVEEATGTALARDAFHGGDETTAFSRLRELGFEIVLKKAISDLLEGFLAQAKDGTDLTVKQYAKEYRGLQIRVSFGQGVSARVPWIAFLGEGQKVSEGIYPVILYYRDAQALILAYGMSEENGASRTWKHIGKIATIQEYLEGNFSKMPERYGDSFVDIGYELSKPVPITEVASRLDRMIDLYKKELADVPATSPVAPIAPSKAADIQGGTAKNIIYYGPPGTGKTYKTAEKAVSLCDGQVPVGGRPALLSRYRELIAAKRIEFVTFHQSYSYEDFVEGLRPDLDDPNTALEAKHGLKLSVQPGIFKAISDRASEDRGAATASLADVEKHGAFKMSLGRSADDDDAYLYQEAIRDGYVLLGYGGDIDWSDKAYEKFSAILSKWQEREPGATGNNPNVQQIFTLRNDMREDDFVVISDGNKRFRAIGQIKSPYEFASRERDTYFHRRKVNWLWKRPEGLPREEIYEKQFSQVSAYRLVSEHVKWPALARLIAGGEGAANQALPQPYVLIIDEINRGNISKIFGELITLIEPDKRKGADEEISVKLPYSQKEFGVPPNLHIIGTMNTADRSIALLDTALRRRFEFEELAPMSSLISQDIQGVNARAAFEGINNRIEYLYDRDHLIGHAYMQKCKTLDQLNETMRTRVIPLLVEYFYEDWEKVRAVLKETKNEGAFIVRHVLAPALGNADDSFGGQERWRYFIKPAFNPSDYEQLA